MKHNKILLVTAGTGGPEAVATWTAIASCWPGGPAPVPTVRDALDITNNNSKLPLETFDAVIVLHAGDIVENSVHKLIDQLSQPCVPILFLTDHSNITEASLDNTVAIEPLDAPPDRIAGLLTGLTARQPTIDALNVDLAQASRSQTGIQTEIEKINAELQLAATIQRELIPPSLPAIDGLDLGVLFRPAGFVSGDVYNAAMIDDRRLAFFLADAVGHGVPAALLTMIISHTLDLSPTADDVDPAQAMKRLNSALCAVGGDTPRFATAVFGVLDVPTRTVTLCNAGHPPPIIVNSDKVAQVETGGPLLGVFDAAEFESETIGIADSTLLLYSDGFEVAFANDKTDSDGRPLHNADYLDHLIPVARDSRNVSDALFELAERLGHEAGSLHQPDDVTAFAVRPI